MGSVLVATVRTKEPPAIGAERKRKNLRAAQIT